MYASIIVRSTHPPPLPLAPASKPQKHLHSHRIAPHLLLPAYVFLYCTPHTKHTHAYLRPPSQGGPISRLVTELLAEIKADPNFINDLLAELFPGSITPSNAIGDSGVVKMGDAASASTGSGVQGAGAGAEGGGVQGSFSFHVSVSGADGGPPPPEFAELLRRILEAIG